MAFHCPLRFFSWQKCLLLSISTPTSDSHRLGESKQQLREAHLPFAVMETGDRAPGEMAKDRGGQVGVGRSSGCRSPRSCCFCLGAGIWPGSEEDTIHPKAPAGTSALSFISTDTEEREDRCSEHENRWVETMILEQK